MPPHPPKPGYRWCKGVFAEIRFAKTHVWDPYRPEKPVSIKGEVSRRVPDVCAGCFARKHQPEDCDYPEWFEVFEHLVD